MKWQGWVALIWLILTFGHLIYLSVKKTRERKQKEVADSATKEERNGEHP